MSRAPSLGERFVGLAFPLSEVCADDAVTFPAHAWPGGYPLAYLTGDGETLCADCATRQLASNRDDLRTYLAGVESIADLRYFRVNATDTLAAYFVHWEGPPEVCADCNAVIASAYGDPEADDDDGDAYDPEHVHVWGPLTRSRLAGTVHRECTVVGCRVINALDDDDDDESGE